MSINRIKQFYWAINSKIDEEDIMLIDEMLTKEEKLLFLKLSKGEQKHCIRVARDIIKSCVAYKNIDVYRLTKAALLHDIGKISCKLNVVDKSVIVVLDKITKGRIKEFSKMKKIDIYYNHGNKAYYLLKPYISDKKLLSLISNHHKKNMYEDEEMKLLKICDDRN